MIFYFMLFHNGNVFNSCYFKLSIDTLPYFMRERNLNIKTFWYLVHVISWNKNTLKKSGKLTHVESFVVRYLQMIVMERKKYRHESSIYFTRWRNIMPGCWSWREGARGTGSTCFELGWKAPFSIIYLRLLNKSILKL